MEGLLGGLFWFVVSTLTLAQAARFAGVRQVTLRQAAIVNLVQRAVLVAIVNLVAIIQPDFGPVGWTLLIAAVMLLEVGIIKRGFHTTWGQAGGTMLFNLLLLMVIGILYDVIFPGSVWDGIGFLWRP